MKLYGTTSFFVLTKNQSLEAIFFSIGVLKIGDLLLCNNTTTFSFTNLLLNPDSAKFFCDEHH